MISLSTFNMLIAVMLVLVIYSVIDLRNKMYANIVTAFLSSFIGGYLSVAVAAGIVQYNDGTLIQDASLGTVLFLIAIVMGIYALYMVYEAREEKRMEAEG